MTLDEDDADFAFDGEPWTVGKLREALEGLPADMPLTALAEFEAGEIDDYVIVDAGLLSEMVVEEIEPDIDEFVLLCALREEEDEDDEGDEDEDETDGEDQEDGEPSDEAAAKPE